MTAADAALDARDAVLALPFVSVAPAARDSARLDRSGLQASQPLAVARPSTVVQVQDLVRAANLARIPVITRGAGSGLAGGAAATADAVILDLSALNRIVSIEPRDRLAVVEPGVVTADLDRAARAHGLRYAPDPASAAISTIGGNIATNAGGLRCVKYGVTRDAVRALDVVLADGRLLSLGATTRKGVTGYDLVSLFVGSEGTLGVVVGATVALSPLPAATATVRASFATVGDAARAVASVLASGVTPAVAELLDAATLEAIDAYRGTSWGAAGGALVLMQTEGVAARAELDEVARVLRFSGGEVEATNDAAEGEALLAARRDALPAIEAIGAPVIEDIAVPLSRVADAVDELQAIAARHGVRIFTFAHAGDGNLHPLVVATSDTSDVDGAADAIFALALRLGGTVTGEHGVGQLKRAWARRELGEVALDVHAAVRGALDPHAIFNPGRAF
ncbi:MAG: FAD-binding oxidoreductase [Demequina sp.]|uniref:FAD-binding oxidoreductase n=1 Tax=Demequina sp. TaxID=2050685 RepID=UPI003A8AD4A7